MLNVQRRRRESRLSVLPVSVLNLHRAEVCHRPAGGQIDGGVHRRPAWKTGDQTVGDDGRTDLPGTGGRVGGVAAGEE